LTRTRSTAIWTFVITSLALFMVALDNLVVTTALPVIKTDLGASLQDLQWIVNAYTLTFAVLLITGAALGDRFGRKRVFLIGMGIFIGGSALAALSTSTDSLILARAIQGVGGAIVTPLTLTILSAAMPPERRAVALGAWGGIAGLAIAIGPLVGGAIAEGLDWHWIFWLNVPIGLVVLPMATFRLTESYGPESRLDVPGLGLISAGLLALVWGVINGNDLGWGSTQIVAALVAGTALLIAFVVWEARQERPMLPMSFFRSRAFSAANAVSLLMYFGMFGSVFLLAQFFQVAHRICCLGRVVIAAGDPIIADRRLSKSPVKGGRRYGRQSGEDHSAARRTQGSCAIRRRTGTIVDRISASRECCRCHVAWDLSYAGDEGGIVCHLSRSEETGRALVVSLTHVRVPRSMPLAAAVLDYQKHRVKKLKEQGRR